MLFPTLPTGVESLRGLAGFSARPIHWVTAPYGGDTSGDNSAQLVGATLAVARDIAAPRGPTRCA